MNPTATWDVPFRETQKREGKRPVIYHLAEREESFDRAICGKAREGRPLEPNAQGELCVVCRDMYFRKHGRNWGES